MRPPRLWACTPLTRWGLGARGPPPADLSLWVPFRTVGRSWGLGELSVCPESGGRGHVRAGGWLNDLPTSAVLDLCMFQCKSLSG